MWNVSGIQEDWICYNNGGVIRGESSVVASQDIISSSSRLAGGHVSTSRWLETIHQLPATSRGTTDFLDQLNSFLLFDVSTDTSHKWVEQIKHRIHYDKLAAYPSFAKLLIKQI